MTRRVCRDPGCPALVPADAYRGRCPQHQRTYDAQRGTPEARGYDTEYVDLKATYERQVLDGNPLVCVICLEPIVGPPVTPQHSRERDRIVGPSHPSCNLRDAGLASHGLPWTPGGGG
jgi:hypothetical protein